MPGVIDHHRVVRPGFQRHPVQRTQQRRAAGVLHQHGVVAQGAGQQVAHRARIGHRAAEAGDAQVLVAVDAHQQRDLAFDLRHGRAAHLALADLAPLRGLTRLQHLLLERFGDQAQAGLQLGRCLAGPHGGQLGRLLQAGQGIAEELLLEGVAGGQQALLLGPRHCRQAHRPEAQVAALAGQRGRGVQRSTFRRAGGRRHRRQGQQGAGGGGLRLGVAGQHDCLGGRRQRRVSGGRRPLRRARRGLWRNGRHNRGCNGRRSGERYRRHCRCDDAAHQGQWRIAQHRLALCIQEGHRAAGGEQHPLVGANFGRIEAAQRGAADDHLIARQQVADGPEAGADGQPRRVQRHLDVAVQRLAHGHQWRCISKQAG